MTLNLCRLLSAHQLIVVILILETFLYRKPQFEAQVKVRRVPSRLERHGVVTLKYHLS